MLFCIGTGEPGAPAPAEGGGSVLRLLSNQNFNPTRLIVVSFGAIILLGTFLLHLPISRPGRAVHPLADLPVHRHLRHLRHRSGHL